MFMTKRKRKFQGGDGGDDISVDTAQESPSSTLHQSGREQQASVSNTLSAITQPILESRFDFTTNEEAPMGAEGLPSSGEVTFCSYFQMPQLQKLDDVLQFPQGIPESDISLNMTRNNGRLNYTITFTFDSPGVEPTPGERIPPDENLALQFKKDWHRSVYNFIHPGGKQQINLNSTDPSEYINNSLITGFTGELKAKHLTEVAHQGNQGVFAEKNLTLWKGDNIITQAEFKPLFDIEVTLENKLKLTSTMLFEITNTAARHGSGERVSDVLIVHTRTNFFNVKPSEDDVADIGILSEEIRGWTMKIQFTMN